MLPPSQLILLVILIVLALILLNWEINPPFASDDAPEENPGSEAKRTKSE
jgi:hypothetical protein